MGRITYAAIAQHDFPSVGRRNPAQTRLLPATARAVVLALGAFFIVWIALAWPAAQSMIDAAPGGLERPKVAAKRSIPSRIAPAPAAAHAPLGRLMARFGPGLSLGRTPVLFAQNAPLASRFTPFHRRRPRAVAPAAIAERDTIAVGADRTSLGDAGGAQARIVPQLPMVSELDIPVPRPRPASLSVRQARFPAPLPLVAEVDVPIPPPRPALLSLPSERPTRLPARQRIARQTARAHMAPESATASADHRTFFEKLFGMPQPSGTAAAYAAPETGGLGLRPSLAGSYDRYTAVYEIASHTVYLPDGTRLEAHSGLGSRLDDPRGVRQRMVGATPPNVYELEPRAQLFHGVRALRLNPVGNGTTYGRNGLLAHTYMLGRRGDSNGCVAFRDYNAFLHAYDSGVIRRLAVVARLD